MSTPSLELVVTSVVQNALAPLHCMIHFAEGVEQIPNRVQAVHLYQNGQLSSGTLFLSNVREKYIGVSLTKPIDIQHGTLTLRLEPMSVQQKLALISPKEEILPLITVDDMQGIKQGDFVNIRVQVERVYYLGSNDEQPTYVDWLRLRLPQKSRIGRAVDVFADINARSFLDLVDKAKSKE